MKCFLRKAQHLRRYFLFGFLAVGLFLALPFLILAAPGDLDLTFGSGGIVITRGNNFNHLDTALGMAIQPDGKIVVVGDGSSGTNWVTWDFAVVRYNPDGLLDTSFGGTGIVITPVGNSHDQAYSVAIQADGKIVVVGGICNGVGDCSSAGSSFAVVRYNPNGSPDTSFNGTGKIITSAGSSWGRANSVAIQADGKIVVAGSSDNGIVIVRYNSNGSLDTTFNGTGNIITPNGNDGGYTPSMAIQADGKVIVIGSSYNGSGYDFTIFRYNTDGSLDTSFNGTGKVITSSVAGGGLAIQPDGKIVVAGGSYDSSVGSRLAVVRYNLNGSLDTSFNDTGKVFTSVGGGANSVAIQADGKIVIVGSNFDVVRLNPNGSLDSSFGGTGKVITPFCCQSYSIAVAIQADGKIVLAGGTDDLAYDFYDFVAVRYQGNSDSNTHTRFDFDGDGKADISVFRPSDRTWYLNRSTAGFAAAQFGLSTDKIVPADFDDDGKTDIAVFRDGFWYWLSSSNGNFNAVQFGISSDIPVPADYTGDGCAELAVYRSGNWYTLNLANNQFQAVQFGLSTDKPVVGDYDGDERADYAVYRDGIWYLLQSTQGFAAIQFGLTTDKLVHADYDGDGKTDQAVYRDGFWYLLQSSQGFTAFQFGVASDVPAPADYDGDGRADAAVYRDGVWYLRQSTNRTAIQQFGLPNDKPIPTAYSP